MRAQRSHHCRGCRCDTPQRYAFSENGTHPAVETWICTLCGLQLVTYGGNAIPDVDGLCLYVLGERLRKSGVRGFDVDGGHLDRLRPTGDDRWLDYEDALLQLKEEAFKAYCRFKPELGVPLRAYVTGTLRQRLTDWYRIQLGRDEPKPFASAVALDAFENDGSGADPYEDGGEGTPLERLIGAGPGDPADDCDADLRWALATRGSGETRGGRASDAARAGARDTGVTD